MATKLEAVYKGYTIEWNDYSCSLLITQHGEKVTNATFKTVEDCENWIDKQVKRKFKHVPAYKIGNFNGPAYITGKVTSLVDNGWCWFISDTGYRSKEPMRDVFPINEFNTDIVKQAESKAAAINVLRTELDKLHAGLLRITSEDCEVSK